MLPYLDGLIQDIVAAVYGDLQRQTQAEVVLERMQRQGWNLSSPVQRLWAGERNLDRLLAGLDSDEQQVVQEVIDLLGLVEAGDSPQALPPELEPDLAGLPEAVRQALLAQDEAALQAALPGLDQAAQARLQQILQQWNTAPAPDTTGLEMVYQIAPMLEVFAAATQGDPGLRRQAGQFLEILDEQGWRLTPSVQAILEGERDPAHLLSGLGEPERQVIQVLLDILSGN